MEVALGVERVEVDVSIDVDLDGDERERDPRARHDRERGRVASKAAVAQVEDVLSARREVFDAMVPALVEQGLVERTEPVEIARGLARSERSLGDRGERDDEAEGSDGQACPGVAASRHGRTVFTGGAERR